MCSIAAQQSDADETASWRVRAANGHERCFDLAAVGPRQVSCVDGDGVMVKSKGGSEHRVSGHTVIWVRSRLLFNFAA